MTPFEQHLQENASKRLKREVPLTTHSSGAGDNFVALATSPKLSLNPTTDTFSGQSSVVNFGLSVPQQFHNHFTSYPNQSNSTNIFGSSVGVGSNTPVTNANQFSLQRQQSTGASSNFHFSSGSTMNSFKHPFARSSPPTTAVLGGVASFVNSSSTSGNASAQNSSSPPIGNSMGVFNAASLLQRGQAQPIAGVPSHSPSMSSPSLAQLSGFSNYSQHAPSNDTEDSSHPLALNSARAGMSSGSEYNSYLQSSMASNASSHALKPTHPGMLAPQLQPSMNTMAQTVLHNAAHNLQQQQNVPERDASQLAMQPQLQTPSQAQQTKSPQPYGTPAVKEQEIEEQMPAGARGRLLKASKGVPMSLPEPPVALSGSGAHRHQLLDGDILNELMEYLRELDEKVVCTRQIASKYNVAFYKGKSCTKSHERHPFLPEYCIKTLASRNCVACLYFRRGTVTRLMNGDDDNTDTANSQPAAPPVESHPSQGHVKDSRTRKRNTDHFGNKHQLLTTPASRAAQAALVAQTTAATVPVLGLHGSNLAALAAQNPVLNNALGMGMGVGMGMAMGMGMGINSSGNHNGVGTVGAQLQGLGAHMLGQSYSAATTNYNSLASTSSASTDAATGSGLASFSSRSVLTQALAARVPGALASQSSNTSNARMPGADQVQPLRKNLNALASRPPQPLSALTLSTPTSSGILGHSLFSNSTMPSPITPASGTVSSVSETDNALGSNLLGGVTPSNNPFLLRALASPATQSQAVATLANASSLRGVAALGSPSESNTPNLSTGLESALTLGAGLDASIGEGHLSSTSRLAPLMQHTPGSQLFSVGQLAQGSGVQGPYPTLGSHASLAPSPPPPNTGLASSAFIGTNDQPTLTPTASSRDPALAPPLQASPASIFAALTTAAQSAIPSDSKTPLSDAPLPGLPAVTAAALAALIASASAAPADLPPLVAATLASNCASDADIAVAAALALGHVLQQQNQQANGNNDAVRAATAVTSAPAPSPSSSTPSVPSTSAPSFTSSSTSSTSSASTTPGSDAIAALAALTQRVATSTTLPAAPTGGTSMSAYNRQFSSSTLPAFSTTAFTPTRLPLSVTQTPAEPLHIDHLQRLQMRVFNSLVQHKQVRQFGSSGLLEPFRALVEDEEEREPPAGPDRVGGML